MNSSPIIDEIRQCREEHARSCNSDLLQIVNDIRRTEEELREQGWTVVIEKAKMCSPTGTSEAETGRRV